MGNLASIAAPHAAMETKMDTTKALQDIHAAERWITAIWRQANTEIKMGEPADQAWKRAWKYLIDLDTNDFDIDGTIAINNAVLLAWSRVEIESNPPVARHDTAPKDELVALLGDLLPYATAAVGLPRDQWPHDSVILRAERVLAAYRANNTCRKTGQPCTGPRVRIPYSTEYVNCECLAAQR